VDTGSPRADLENPVYRFEVGNRFAANCHLQMIEPSCSLYMETASQHGFLLRDDAAPVIARFGFVLRLLALGATAGISQVRFLFAASATRHHAN
jgi:hypothetical protein